MLATCRPCAKAATIKNRSAGRCRVARPQASTRTLDAASPQNNGATQVASGKLPSDLKLRLLQEIAGTDRGACASLASHRKINRILEDLTDLQADAEDVAPDQLDGTWELLYTTAETFRSSPFFHAFQDGLIGDRDMASAIFKITDSIPGAHIGRALQEIDLTKGSLVSKVDMSVFPGLTGTVTTECSISGVGRTLYMTVEQTSVQNSPLFPFLETLPVPVKPVLEQLRGKGAADVGADVKYIDDSLRYIVFNDQQKFVYGRVA